MQNEADIDVRNYECIEDAAEQIEQMLGPIIWQPVHMYVHSGVVLNTNGFDDPWDSGCAGLIYVTAKTARDELGCAEIMTEDERRVYEG